MEISPNDKSITLNFKGDKKTSKEECSLTTDEKKNGFLSKQRITNTYINSKKMAKGIIKVKFNNKEEILVFPGTYGEYDFIVKYNLEGKGRDKQPSHTVWLLDVIRKKNKNSEETLYLIDKMLSLWSDSLPLKTYDYNSIKEHFMFSINNVDFDRIKDIDSIGIPNKVIYTIVYFLILQERNKDNAHFFRDMLENLKNNKDDEAMRLASFRGGKNK